MRVWFQSGCTKTAAVPVLTGGRAKFQLVSKSAWDLPRTVHCASPTARTNTPAQRSDKRAAKCEGHFVKGGFLFSNHRPTSRGHMEACFRTLAQ